MTPAQAAKGALRRLAQAQQEPTPENYARAWVEETGQAPASDARALGPAWAALVGKLVRGIERGSKQWTQSRRKESLQRVLDGSGSDLQRLQQRLQSLVAAWDTDRAEAAADVGVDAAAEAAAPAGESAAATVAGDPRSSAAHDPGDPASSPVQAPGDSRSSAAYDSGDSRSSAAHDPGDPRSSAAHDPGDPRSSAAHDPGDLRSTTARAPGDDRSAAPAAADQRLLAARLQATLAEGLRQAAPQAVDVADRLAALADAIAADGPTAARLAEVDAACAEAARVFAQRNRLVDELAALARELGGGLVELAEDESWARGQAAALTEHLSGEPSVRGVRAAGHLLAETRRRHARVRADRDAARDALKALLQRMLGELGALESQTGRFEQSVGRHAEAIERAESLQSLAGVVRQIVDESRAVQTLVGQARARLHDEHAKAAELESRVRALEGELRRLSDEAATDALTRVANRRGLEQAFDAERSRAERAGDAEPPLSIGLIDIDNFKRLNDSLGHAAGDQALQALAAAVRERLRPVDTLARFGGEEFVVLLPATPATEARDALTRLQRSLTEALFLHEEREVFVTFSAGVTAWRRGESLHAALERADAALYEAKRGGKNRTVVG